MKLIVLDDKILVLVIEKAIRLARDVKCREGVRLTAELKLNLLEMIAVNMAVTARPDKVTHLETTLLGNHVSEQGVTGDIEWNTQKDVRTALI